MTQPPDWPALLNLGQSAQYCGMSPDSFLLCVEKGRFPKAVDLPIRRKLWQRSALDAAIGQGKHDDARFREEQWKRRRESRLSNAG